MTKWTCVRKDGRDLIEEWLGEESKKRKYVKSREELENLEVEDGEQVLGNWVDQRYFT